jgi:3-oxoadipate enol-lactonase
MAEVATPLGRWFYVERGSGGTAVVLLPSLLFDHRMWREQLGPLSELGRVLAFDPPGHGRSEVPPPFSMPDHADALAAALATLGVERAVLVGLSWGAMVSLQLALRHPSIPAALALLDTSADPESTWHRVKYGALASYARWFGARPWLARSQVAPLLFGRRALATRPELVEEWIASVDAYPRLGIARAVAAVTSPPGVLGRLAGVNVPALVVCGRDDRSTPLAHSERIAAALPRARLEVVEGAGHASALEAPQAVNRLLVPFVREHLVAAAALAQP